MLSPLAIDPAILTERRREVLDLILEGLTNQEIGKKLFLSADTVKTHVRKLFSIFGVHSRTELIVACYRSGFVPCGRCRRAQGVRRG